MSDDEKRQKVLNYCQQHNMTPGQLQNRLMAGALAGLTPEQDQFFRVWYPTVYNLATGGDYYAELYRKAA